MAMNTTPLSPKGQDLGSAFCMLYKLEAAAELLNYRKQNDYHYKPSRTLLQEPTKSFISPLNSRESPTSSSSQASYLFTMTRTRGTYLFLGVSHGPSIRQHDSPPPKSCLQFTYCNGREQSHGKRIRFADSQLPFDILGNIVRPALDVNCHFDCKEWHKASGVMSAQEGKSKSQLDMGQMAKWFSFRTSSMRSIDSDELDIFMVKMEVID
ncbi:hypothetical protein EV421DRAFT_1738313 [Armillaria borealis]|uniref:Uncharacterized protein n=1 Tax=Armillaria borealis TaxID=47425 RepID=A0AA39J9C7_9AGAR|nr:hypothetical protein EV421DRAFT_1738313 [Armillaria borealis]